MKGAISVRLDSEFVEKAKLYADVAHRSTPKQIEYWATIGRIAEDNPDLSYAFIAEAMTATAEMNSGRIEPYERSTPRKRKR